MNFGGHLVWLQPAKCNPSSNDRCLTSVESENLCQWFCQCRAVTNICEELHFLWRFHMSCSWQGWWGCLPPHIITLVEGWKDAVVKAGRAAACADSSVVTLHHLCSGHAMLLFSFTIFYFFEWFWEKNYGLQSGRGCKQTIPADISTYPSRGEQALHQDTVVCIECWTVLSSVNKLMIQNKKRKVPIKACFGSNLSIRRIPWSLHNRQTCHRFLQPKPVLEVVPAVNHTLEHVYTCNMPHI